MQNIQSRRSFLASATWAGAAGLVGVPKSLHAEPPPEIDKFRLPMFFNANCSAPVYIAEELLRAEGIEVQWVKSGTGPDTSDWLEHGELDFDYNFPPGHVRSIEKGIAITVLAGVHAGCLELIANENIRSIVDLKGKSVGLDPSVTAFLLMIIVAYVGLDPEKDIRWIRMADADPLELLASGKIDAFLGTPPTPQAARARKIGHVILKTSVDPPWSQYFCCMLGGAADYVRRHPVATKRILRAHLKAADLCLSSPELVARQLVERKFADDYGYALETMTDVRFDAWRLYDAEDSLRFYALRMHELGMIKSSPQKIIDSGTDWRFLDELRRELKT
jgi:NitT/TauT family transport system substrate-binding protein